MISGSGKKRSRRRITVDTSRPDRLHPPPHQHPPEGLGEEEPMEVEEEEDKMPPKMRKRWIHRSAEALKDSQTRSSESPGGSVVSLGSAVSGGIGLGIKMDDHSGSGGDGESERMEIDGESSCNLIMTFNLTCVSILQQTQNKCLLPQCLPPSTQQQSLLSTNGINHDIHSTTHQRTWYQLHLRRLLLNYLCYHLLSLRCRRWQRQALLIVRRCLPINPGAHFDMMAPTILPLLL